jgi:hypothetical protein
MGRCMYWKWFVETQIEILGQNLICIKSDFVPKDFGIYVITIILCYEQQLLHICKVGFLMDLQGL